MSQTELLDGMKRRIGTTLGNPDASAEWLLNQVRGMQRFIMEWEKRNGAPPGIAAPLPPPITTKDDHIMKKIA